MREHYLQITTEGPAMVMAMGVNSGTVRQIAGTLYHASLTISRELAWIAARSDRPVFVASDTCIYDVCAAGVRARRDRFKCRSRSKLITYTVLFGVVHYFLCED